MYKILFSFFSYPILLCVLPSLMKLLTFAFLSAFLFILSFVYYGVLLNEIKFAFVAQYHELAAEAFDLMAIVFDKLGQLEKREGAAASFKNHIMALENPQDVEDHLLNA